MAAWRAVTCRWSRPEATEEDYDCPRLSDSARRRGRVVLAMHRAFPDAPIYTTLYDPEVFLPRVQDAKIITSPLNKIGYLRRNHRMALPILPFASSFLKVPAERAVVSTTGWAHGFNFAGRKVHLLPFAGALAVPERSVPGREHRPRYRCC